MPILLSNQTQRVKISQKNFKVYWDESIAVDHSQNSPL